MLGMSTGSLQTCSAVLAEFGVCIMSFTAALRTALSAYDALLVLHGPLGCYDARRNGEYGISGDHEKSGYRLSYVCLWGNVSVSDGCYRDNSPINTARYAGEAVFFTLY